jgi:hypothetical protein
METSAPQNALPCLIPAFNNPTYVRGMLRQLSIFPELKLFVVDNASTYPPMLDLYREIEDGSHGEAAVIRLGCNAGPRTVWYHLDTMPLYFCLTDPDLEINPNLPSDFIWRLIELTETYQVGKAGFALSLADQDTMLDNKFRHIEGEMTIWEAEAKNWAVPLPPCPALGQPLYLANIDTTFAVYNKRYFNADSPWDAVRVAGSYTCRHLPWYRENHLPADEESYYRRTTEFSYYLGDRPAVQMREVFARQDALGSFHAAS